MSVDIKFSKINKTYVAGDIVSGVVVVRQPNNKPLSHNGITVTMRGTVRMELSGSSVGRFEALYNSAKPIDVVGYSVDIVPEGKFPPGQTELQFEFPLKAKKNQEIYDTYHGYYITVQYVLEVEMKRGIMSKPIGKAVEFIVECPSPPPAELKQVKRQKIPFELSPKSVTHKATSLPEFEITGLLDSQEWSVTDRCTGHIQVISTSVPIRSVEMQLLRIETQGCLEGFSKDESEIQNIQIVDGDVLKNVKVPIMMVFPRLFTCPTVHAKSFKVDFEMNFVVVFKDGRLIKRNFPIKLHRSKNTEI